MRLWHQVLLPFLDNKRLLSQHRECCALRGKGWGRKHSTVDYVFKYDRSRLFAYHSLVMHWMWRRNYNPAIKWCNPRYRGNNIAMDENLGNFRYYACHGYPSIDSFRSPSIECIDFMLSSCNWCPVYPEHDIKYLRECLENLQSKGVELVNNVSIEMILMKLDLKLKLN